jgi:hypothetical protein
MKRLLLTLALAAVLPTVACNPGDAMCAKVEECFDDDVDFEDDFQAICQEENRAQEDILRANEEDDCHVLADTKNAWYACLNGLECNDLEDELQEADECEDQYDDYVDAQQDVDDDCQVSTSPTGER